VRVDPESFEAAYADGADPWDFATSAYEQRRYDAIESLLRPQPTDGGWAYRRCFEPASSVGVLTERLAARCAQVVAVDPSASAVATAADRLGALVPGRVELAAGSIPEWWPTGSFDLVVFSELGYYWDALELHDLVDRTNGLLDDGGDFVSAHWLGESPDHVLHGSTVHAVLVDVLGTPARQLDGDGFVAAVWR
jgi:nodulation protein S (NodS)